MSDDSFIREVDEELRSERMKDFWSRYGKIVIAVAVAVVVGTAGYRYYEFSRTSKAAASGDAFMAAIKLAEDGKSEEAVEALKAVEAGTDGAYKSMARLRGAAELVKKGDAAAALAMFDSVASDTTADENLRSIANVRAAMLLVDTGSVSDVEQRVSSLSAPGNAYRFSAREALGLAYYKADDLEKSFKQFEAIQKEDDVPPSMRQRTRIMLDLIAAKGGPKLEQ